MISLAAPEDLSTFVRDVVREMTPVSTITIEHTTEGRGHAIKQRAIISKEAFLVLDETLRSRKTHAARSSAYLQAPAVARMLGIKTGTLAKWRRLGTGPKNWVRTNRTTVVYPVEEVEASSRGGRARLTMPIDTKKYTRVARGLKWNRRTKTALFDVLAPGSKERFRRVLPFASVEEALAAFTSFRALVKAGHRPETGDATEADLPEHSTFAEYVARHLDSIWGGTALSTRRRNMSSLNSYLIPFFGPKRLNEIADIDAKDFKTWCRTRADNDGKPKPLAPPTINFALRRFREVMNNAKTRKLLESIPLIKFEKETENKNEFNPEEEAAFLTAFDDLDGFRRYLTEHRKLAEIIYVEFRQKDPFAGKRRYGSGLDPASDAALAYFDRFQRSKEWFIAALHTGLRRGDLIDLRRASVRFAEGFVTRTMKKTGKVTMVPMSDTLRETLAVAMSRSVAAITDHVFLTEEGIPYPEITIRRYFAIAKSIAGIKRRFRINDLRHTFASDLASDGFSTLVLRDLLGHTTTKQSERYARPNSQVAEAVRASLERRGKADDPSPESTLEAIRGLLNATTQRALTDDERSQLSKLIESSRTGVSATKSDTGDTKGFSAVS